MIHQPYILVFHYFVAHLVGQQIVSHRAMETLSQACFTLLPKTCFVSVCLGSLKFESFKFFHIPIGNLKS